MSALDKALERSRKSIEFNFDEKLYVIRRNLMIASSVVVGSTFISQPKGGMYEVNIGVIKGAVEKPEYISYFLALVCFYYLSWFYIHCRKVTMDNYSSIRTKFMCHLAELIAEDKYKSLTNTPIGTPPRGPAFKALGGGTDGLWNASTLIPPTRGIPEKERLESAGFAAQKTDKGTSISYQHKSGYEDIKYFNIHLDHYWRGKASYIFTTILPMAYSIFAILLLGVHIYNQLSNA